MSEQLNQLLADSAATLVKESFTGVNATWWWERRLGGGIEVCQELDPETMVQKLTHKTGREPNEIRSIVREKFGFEDLEPVVLTSEVPGDATTVEAARILAERSATPEGLAAPLYRRVEEAVRGREGQRGRHEDAAEHEQ